MGKNGSKDLLQGNRNSNCQRSAKECHCQRKCATIKTVIHVICVIIGHQALIKDLLFLTDYAITSGTSQDLLCQDEPNGF